MTDPGLVKQGGRADSTPPTVTVAPLPAPPLPGLFQHLPSPSLQEPFGHKAEVHLSCSPSRRLCPQHSIVKSNCSAIRGLPAARE